MEILKFAEGGGAFLSKKIIYKKTMHFTLRFFIQKGRLFVSHFYIQKTMHFELRF